LIDGWDVKIKKNWKKIYILENIIVKEDIFGLWETTLFENSFGYGSSIGEGIIYKKMLVCTGEHKHEISEVVNYDFNNHTHHDFLKNRN
jgi:hypothetical protein